MKTLRTMMVGLALIAVCGVANAATTSHHGGNAKTEVIDTYVNAIVHGNLNDIDNAIYDDARFYIVHGPRVIISDKSHVLDYLKINEHIDQNCNCKSTVLLDSDEKFVEEVQIQYDAITRTDVITTQLTGDGWKITKVETSFK